MSKEIFAVRPVALADRRIEQIKVFLRTGWTVAEKRPDGIDDARDGGHIIIAGDIDDLARQLGTMRRCNCGPCQSLRTVAAMSY